MSPDLTAREDFNGRVNATQLREASSHFSSLGATAGVDEGLEKGYDIPPFSLASPSLADAKLPRAHHEGK